ncbi:MAG: RNA polymerase sporulation sigma factor SigK [Ruminococcus sp.]|nr:RNA polymerase sporulation sigma factor SigK [Ruminococcus sp.]
MFVLFELLNFIGQYICFFLLHVCGNGSFPKPLSSKEEREYLIKASDGDIDARNKLVEHNLRLVAHIIKKYYSSQNDQDDLVSIGTIGLIKAINTFDINKNIKLSSYASRCIENEILMHFRNIKKTSQDISLNEAIDTDKDGNPLSLIDVLSTDDNILESLNTKLNVSKIYQYISSELDEREQQVIVLRYGLNGEDPITQREVAKILGVSRSYISRIETKALKTLRRKYERSSNL